MMLLLLLSLSVHFCLLRLLTKACAAALNVIIKRFAELPDLWTLYDVLKQD